MGLLGKHVNLYGFRGFESRPFRHPPTSAYALLWRDYGEMSVIKKGDMFYTYILKQKDINHFYIGYTNNLKRRIEEHKSSETISTQGRLWNLYCYFVFPTKKLAEDFERYLKTGSGRAFSKRHFAFKIDEALVKSGKSTKL